MKLDAPTDPFRTEIHLLEPARIQLDRDEHDRLRLRLDGVVYEKVKPVRCFTHTLPEQYVSLSDAEGKEIGLIEDLNALPPAARQLLQEELEKCYFVPEIVRIRQLTSRYGVTSWRVETDRGPRDFQVRSRDDVRRLPRGLILITDIDGNRFRISSRSRLDPRSQGLLDTCL
jgi:hypothetical protein